MAEDAPTDDELRQWLEDHPYNSILMRRRFPLLIAEVQRLRSEALELRKYVKHTHKCGMNPWFNSRECTCGLDELLEKGKRA